MDKEYVRQRWCEIDRIIGEEILPQIQERKHQRVFQYLKDVQLPRKFNRLGLDLPQLVSAWDIGSDPPDDDEAFFVNEDQPVDHPQEHAFFEGVITEIKRMGFTLSELCDQGIYHSQETYAIPEKKVGDTRVTIMIHTGIKKDINGVYRRRVPSPIDAMHIVIMGTGRDNMQHQVGKSFRVSLDSTWLRVVRKHLSTPAWREYILDDKHRCFGCHRNPLIRDTISARPFCIRCGERGTR